MKKIMVWGNTVFTQKVLETIYKIGQYEVSAWTGKSSEMLRKNYSNPVESFAQDNNIPVYSFDSKLYEKESDRLSVLKDVNPDVCIVIAYGKIISQDFLDVPKDGFINIHGSLLPDLRGATPIQTALLKGYEKTGVSIQKMVYKMDAGDLLSEYELEIDDQDNFETLRDKMIDVTIKDLPLFLERYFKREISPKPQDESKATICKISDFKREKGKINWNDEAQNIHNKIRAFYPEPIAWSLYPTSKGDKTINFISSEVSVNESNRVPGAMFMFEKKLYVATHDYDLEITNLVMEGKKPMTGKDFANGYLRKDKDTDLILK